MKGRVCGCRQVRRVPVGSLSEGLLRRYLPASDWAYLPSQHTVYDYLKYGGMVRPKGRKHNNPKKRKTHPQRPKPGNVRLECTTVDEHPPNVFLCKHFGVGRWIILSPDTPAKAAFSSSLNTPLAWCASSASAPSPSPMPHSSSFPTHHSPFASAATPNTPPSLPCYEMEPDVAEMDHAVIDLVSRRDRPRVTP